MEDDRKIEKNTLSAFLEQDREMVMSQLAAGRAQDEALKVLEKEADRIMYRAGASDEMTAGRGGSITGQISETQGMLQVFKNMLPLVTVVSDAEVWEKESKAADSAGTKLPLSAIVSGIAGVVCVIAGLIGTSAFPGLSRIFQLLWAAAGCALLLLAGYLAGRGRGKEKTKKDPDQRHTFLVDPARIWHTLQGTLLSADHSLEMARERARNTEQTTQEDAASKMPKKELQFFSDLLENAYARRRQSPSDETLSEQVESIRYYLHERGVETEDYSSRSAEWFEILPSDSKAVTIRPAMLCNGIVVMKGVASGRLS